MQIELIVAVDTHWAMGKGNDIPWRLPLDWKHFKQTTMGHPMIMGRATFESIGSKPLPGRQNIVVTRNPDFTTPGVDVVHNLAQARACALASGAERCMIIGGASIYRAFLPDAQIIHLTQVEHRVHDADTFFPALDPNAFELVDKQHHSKDTKHPYAFSICRLERRPTHDPFFGPSF